MNRTDNDQAEKLASYWETIMSRGAILPSPGLDPQDVQVVTRLATVLSPAGPDAAFAERLRARLAQGGQQPRQMLNGVPLFRQGISSRAVAAAIAVVLALSLLSAGVYAAVKLIPSTPPPASLDELRILAEGVDKQPGSAGRQVGYGFVLQNPNGDKTVQGGTYEVTAYALHGQIIAQNGGSLPIFSPGELIGVAGTLEIESDQAVDRLHIDLVSGMLSSDQERSLVPEEVRYSDDPVPRAIGVLANPYDVQINDITVSALAYSSDGRIIGGGTAQIESLAPEQTTPLNVPVFSSEVPARVELYAGLSQAPR